MRKALRAGHGTRSQGGFFVLYKNEEAAVQ